jgi:hypothetical protein
MNIDIHMCVCSQRSFIFCHKNELSEDEYNQTRERKERKEKEEKKRKKKQTMSK